MKRRGRGQRVLRVSPSGVSRSDRDRETHSFAASHRAERATFSWPLDPRETGGPWLSEFGLLCQETSGAPAWHLVWRPGLPGVY